MGTFTVYHLRFTVQVETTIVMEAFKGSALRGAWQSHLRTLYCAQTDTADPLHQSLCPVCFLLSRETGSGEDRRPYAFLPPLTTQTTLEPGERLTFGISLFGQAVQFSPYLVLAVGQMGQIQGLGKPLHQTAHARHSRRGTFRLISIAEVNPLSQQQRTLLAEGSAMVQMPQLAVSQQIAASSAEIVQKLSPTNSQLTLHFLTPTRIVSKEHLIKQPHFVPFFARLVDRVSALRHQFSDEPSLTREEKGVLLALADQVKLITNEAPWWDVKGLSTHLGRAQPLGGFVSRALYQAPSLDMWRPLLPWLLWGQSTQVGKNVVKGCGWYVVK